MYILWWAHSFDTDYLSSCVSPELSKIHAVNFLQAAKSCLFWHKFVGENSKQLLSDQNKRFLATFNETLD